MNLFKRALASVTRRGGKTAILLALIFVLGNVIAGAVVTEQSVRNTVGSVLKNITPAASVQMKTDNDPWGGLDPDSVEYLTAGQIEQLGNLSCVEFFDYSEMVWLTSPSLKRWTDPNASQDMPLPRDEFDADIEMEEQTFYTTIHGSQNPEITDRRMNKITLLDQDGSREPTSDETEDGKYVAVVSKEFAELNNLRVGSAFTLEWEIYRDDYLDGLVPLDYGDEPDMSQMYKPAKVLEFEFTVVGLFEPVVSAAANPDDWFYIYELEDRQNRIYTSNKAVRKINDLYAIEVKNINPESELYDSEDYTPMFVFKDAPGLEQFADEAAAIIPENYEVVDNQGSIDKIAAPLKNMSSIAVIVLVGAVGFSLLLLSLLITLFLRDRRHEMGVYLSLGERKIKIVGQILSEVMLIAVVGITLALFSGALISAPLSNYLIEQQVIEQQQNESNWEWNPEYNAVESMGYGADVTLEELVEQYQVAMNPQIILIFYAAGIFTVLVSTLIPVLYVLKLNPKKILM